MSEALPTGDFTFLPEDEVASFDLDSTTKSDDYGYILEVDLKYPNTYTTPTPTIPSLQKN